MSFAQVNLESPELKTNWGELGGFFKNHFLVEEVYSEKNSSCLGPAVILLGDSQHSDFKQEIFRMKFINTWVLKFADPENNPMMNLYLREDLALNSVITPSLRKFHDDLKELLPEIFIGGWSDEKLLNDALEMMKKFNISGSIPSIKEVFSKNKSKLKSETLKAWKKFYKTVLIERNLKLIELLDSIFTTPSYSSNKLRIFIQAGTKHFDGKLINEISPDLGNIQKFLRFRGIPFIYVKSKNSVEAEQLGQELTGPYSEKLLRSQGTKCEYLPGEVLENQLTEVIEKSLTEKGSDREDEFCQDDK